MIDEIRKLEKVLDRLLAEDNWKAAAGFVVLLLDDGFITDLQAGIYINAIRRARACENGKTTTTYAGPLRRSRDLPQALRAWAQNYKRPKADR